MKSIAFYFFLSLAGVAVAQTITVEDTLFSLTNEDVSWKSSLKGSSIIEFKPRHLEVNPFEWVLETKSQPPINENGFDFRGHFISLGTWGMPTIGEQAAGIKLYGDANHQLWTLDSILESTHSIRAISSFKSEIEKLSLSRTVKMTSNQEIVKVEETVKNDLPIGRPYNILQHATFGGRFLTNNTMVFSNAGPGFLQKGSFPLKNYDSLEKRSFNWPHLQMGDTIIDLQNSGQLKKTFLTSHVIPEDLGWAVIYSPDFQTLVGYVWETQDYPWVNFWQQYKEQRLTGWAIEFGTCGMGISFEEMMTENRTFFNNNSFEFIDAGEELKKSYYVFTLVLDESMRGIDSIVKEHDKLFIKAMVNGRIKTLQVFDL